MLNDVINRYLACYNARDIDGMLDCVTQDVVFENISNYLGELVGIGCYDVVELSTTTH